MVQCHHGFPANTVVVVGITITATDVGYDVGAEYICIRAGPHHIRRITHAGRHIAIEAVVAHQASEAATLSALSISTGRIAIGGGVHIAASVGLAVHHDRQHP